MHSVCTYPIHISLLDCGNVTLMNCLQMIKKLISAVTPEISFSLQLQEHDKAKFRDLTCLPKSSTSLNVQISLT